MNREDIIKMAREADIEEAHSLQHGQVLIQFKNGSLERFAALVSAAEREACAVVAEQADNCMNDPYENAAAREIATAIRARGQS